MSERRRFVRVPSALRCWCEGETVTVYARVANLSQGGLFLRTSTPMPLGSRATLRLGGPEGLVLPGVVCWSRAEEGAHLAGMGIAFGALDDETAHRLARLVEGEVPGASFTQ